MMIFLIPTAKEMVEDKQVTPYKLPTKTQTIVDSMATLTAQELAKLYKIKDEASQREYQRWQDLQAGSAPSLPALQLFNGLMYRNIKRSHLSASEENYIKNRLFITSSLYGIMPALHAIAPHRLDFNTKLKIEGNSLKTYWRADYDAFLEEYDQVISLLSSEFEEVFSPKLRQKLVQVSFMENRQGTLKTHSTISKKARGQFFSQAMTTNCQTIEDLKNLSWQGFSYRDDLSSQQKLFFVKMGD